jgi:hypothetical protein
LTGEEAASGEQEAASTITPKERQTFNSIFQEIASRGHRPSRAHLADNVISLVVQDAERSASSRHATTVVDRDVALDKFPPSLRRAASLALDSLQEDADELAHRQGPSASTGDPAQLLGEDELLDWADNGQAIDELVKTATIEEHRRSERRRVEKSMTDAESDVDLWKSMTENVFGMVERLGIGENASTPGKKRPASKEEAARRKKEQLNIYVHGPLYPLLLLRGLRLLDTAFRAPSQLALSVLPRVQELGLASYVLGASTPFYNTLMGIYWHRYGDVSAVFSLLEEMRRAGLSFDEDTLELLQDMEKDMSPYAEGERGSFVQELTAMPEYEPVFDSRLPHWERVIRGAIEDKKREAAF